MNIYVGNLNYRVKEGDLQQVMEDYGAVSSVKVIMDRETGKSMGHRTKRFFQWSGKMGEKL